ncbi:MAG: NAD(P)-dependent oxidoreductase [Nitrososphaeria archaeon]|nr:NAD(P)-dependent oxidoreductase [Nitrososphaeria archaeon]
MKVLVTGGAGYIGSVLVEMLLERGYKVKCLDRFFFGPTLSHLEGKKDLEIIKDDIRWFNPSYLEDVDCVMDLAALSNDPAGELDPEKTMDINYRGRVRVATLAKKKGVERYILASSCSIYGFQEGTVNEESNINPLTTYAKANRLAEEGAFELADEKFCVTALRQATVYGLSPRMRFDLVLNVMTLNMWKEGKLRIVGDGKQWRPLVYVKDTANAFIKTLEADKEKVNNQIFNVGSNEQNYQIIDLANIIADALKMELKYERYGDPDRRSYRVDFTKIKKTLNFTPKYDPTYAVVEIRDALEEGKIKDDMKTRTVEWYKFLIETQKLLRDIEINGLII